MSRNVSEEINAIHRWFSTHAKPLAESIANFRNELETAGFNREVADKIVVAFLCGRNVSQ